ncbi:dihydroxyacetone kinase subunit DhaK [Sutcliffiella sp. NPDC057660]|uniref:dihydroxyacetone kinase subunit DhaK n=1 Tax=Sutcliffiella sp. NPDC057660 TaxID=3346199 RepID=UPI00368BF3F8
MRKDIKDKVVIVTGGGSGHEPLFLGFIGEGLVDGVATGTVFAAPTPNTVQDVA